MKKRFSYLILILASCFAFYRFIFLNPAGINLLRINEMAINSIYFAEAVNAILNEIQSDNDKTVLFVYTDKITAGCAEGKIVQWLGKIQDKYDGFLEIVVLLPQEYSENDLKNVSAYFPSLQHFYRINDSLQEKVEIYRKKPDRHFISGYSFFTDQNGRVLNVTHFIHPFYSIEEQAAKIIGFLESMMDDAPKK